MDWPLLLAGPIVRRVTARSVAVFVATKASVEVALSIHDGVDASAPLMTTATRDTIALGDLLHVCVVEVVWEKPTLEPGRLYGYNVLLKPKTGDPEDLSDLMWAEVPLGYAPGLFPGFVLPGPLDTLRIVQGSCRKPHGSEESSLLDPDALPLVDRLIQQSHTDPLNRPQQLLLTGDQIYADDVPAALLAALTSAGGLLLGSAFQETLPDRHGGSEIPPIDGRVEPGDRCWFLDDQGAKDHPPGATGWDDYAANHLLYYAEWCAMYLFVWSPELWQRLDNVLPALRTDDTFYHYLPPATEFGVPASTPDTTFPTLIFAQGLVFVRRAMANIATYMIFDDHDVTDDWFLNAKVSDQLRGQGEKPGPVGPRMLRNALAAYAVFQHWGNAPDAFVPGTCGGRLLDMLKADNGPPLIATAGQAADVILDVGPEPVGPDRRSERMRWDYEVSFAEHRLLVLDTRTWRGFPTGPRPLTAVEIVDAATGQTVVHLDWGPAGLGTVAAAWEAAEGGITAPISALLFAGVEFLAAFAALGTIGGARSGAFAASADRARAAAGGVLDGVDLAPALDSQRWAADAIRVARVAVDASRYAPDGDLVESVLRVATALHEAEFHLREAIEDLLEGLLDETAIAFLTAFESLANLLGHAASFVEGALYSRPRAARHAADLVRAWDDLAYDNAATLWGGLSDTTKLALDDASGASAEIRASLADAATAFAKTRDPVWDLLNAPLRRRNAELISAEALTFQVSERIWTAESRPELTIVVSPAPVFGHGFAEFLQRAAIAAGGPEPEEEYENEPWSGNMPALNRFLDALAPLGSVVVFSGDVHYAYSAVVEYIGNDGLVSRFVQLTASSAKNSFMKSRALAVLDEAKGALSDSLGTPLDFFDNLPPQSVWDGLDPEMRDVVPSREQVMQALAEQRRAIEAAATARARASGTWWSGLFDGPGLRDALTSPDTGAWDSQNQDTAAQAAAELGAVEQLAGDPVGAFAGDRVNATPTVLGGEVAFNHALGLDPRRLPEHRMVVLRDRRADARAADSPGLRARLDADPLKAMALVRSDRSTVGHANIGVVTTHTTRHGRFVTHELHWFPFDTAVAQSQPDSPGAAFRDDWIITRHCGGLTVGMPFDGALVGACGPSAPAPGGPDVWLHFDVSSPAQIQQGDTRVHAITAAAPTMPDVTVTVRIIGLSSAADAALTREVRLECTYHDANRTDVVYVPGPTKDNWQLLETGRTTWRPSFPYFCGGDLVVYARTALIPVGHTRPRSHAILGRNPSKADIRAHAANHAAAIGWAPPYTNIEVALHRESKFTQFAASPSALGPFVEGPASVLYSSSFSYGIGQLDRDPFPESYQLWHWRLNVEEAVRRMNAVRADARVYAGQVRGGDSWTAATGTLDPPPPNERTEFRDAPPFTEDELDLEMWARYNCGRRYHDWDDLEKRWVRQQSTNRGVTVYAPALQVMRGRVDAGDLPGGW